MSEKAAITSASMQREMVDGVQQKIEALEKEGAINFPPNYSVSNALRSAWLIIQETKDLNRRPALEVCTRESVANAMLNTVVQGLSPAKKQIYYIVYGNQLQAQRSYFGTMAVTKRIPGVADILADVVYPKDTFKASKAGGSWRVEAHESSWENIDPENFAAAYCTIVFEGGGSYTEIMNRAQIEKSWAKSRSKDHTVHKEFPDQMAKRTVINRACKFFLNSSDDSDLLIEAFNATGERFDADAESEKKQDERLRALNAELQSNVSAQPEDGEQELLTQEEEVRANA